MEYGGLRFRSYYVDRRIIRGYVYIELTYVVCIDLPTLPILFASPRC